MKIRALAILPMLFLAACASPQPVRSERLGLMDRLRDMDRASVRSRGRTQAMNLSREPADAAKSADGDAPRATGFRWPLQSVEVTSPFGKRGRDFHEGVDLRAKTGTSVYAAQAGTVLYAGRKIRGYGKMIVIKHGNGLATVYAHNSRLLVKQGQRVRLGQKIAVSGSTGHASGPHLHFEVRDGLAAVDPLRHMPSPSVATAAPIPAARAGSVPVRKVSSRTRVASRSPSGN